MELGADPRVLPLAKNQDAFLTRMTEAPMFAVADEPDALAFSCEVPHPLLNGVLDVRFAPDRIEERTRAVLAAYAEHALPASWFLTPLNWSEELDRALVGLGAVRDQSLGMHLPLGGSEDRLPADWRELPGLPDGLEIVVRRDPERMARVMLAGFEMPDDLLPHLTRVIAGFTEDEVTHAIALLDGVEVGCGTLFVTGATAGLYNIATVPPYRRRGVGLAVTAALLGVARERGCAEAVLGASGTGRPVYEQAGFSGVCLVPTYVWTPS